MVVETFLTLLSAFSDNEAPCSRDKTTSQNRAGLHNSALLLAFTVVHTLRQTPASAWYISCFAYMPGVRRASMGTGMPETSQQFL